MPLHFVVDLVHVCFWSPTWAGSEYFVVFIYANNSQPSEFIQI